MTTMETTATVPTNAAPMNSDAAGDSSDAN
jgi:hypothetical protein